MFGSARHATRSLHLPPWSPMLQGETVRPLAGVGCPTVSLVDESIFNPN